MSIIVLGSGGTIGIAYIGVLKALCEKNMLNDINHFIGTSVGGLVSALCVIGYDYLEMYEFIKLFNISRLISIKIDNILNNYGLDNGDNFDVALQKMFIDKGVDSNITFLQLYEKTHKILELVTSCLNDKQVYSLSHVTTPNLRVITAIRMSCAIPFLFSPVLFDCKLYSDGALLNNYPINFSPNLKQTFGVYLNCHSKQIDKIINFEQCFMSIFQCMTKKNCLNEYLNNTLILSIPKLTIFDINLSLEDKEKLYNIGHRETLMYINDKLADKTPIDYK